MNAIRKVVCLTGGPDIVDAQEFRQMYDQHAQKIYNFILWTKGNASSCDDILQNVFLKVWKSGTVPANDQERTTWLYAITRNAIIDHFRCNRRFAHSSESIDLLEAKIPEHEDDGNLAWEEVSKLPRVERSIVYLHCKVGHSFVEIAKMLDMNNTLVRVKAFRALKKLRSMLIKKGL